MEVKAEDEEKVQWKNFPSQERIGHDGDGRELMHDRNSSHKREKGWGEWRKKMRRGLLNSRRERKMGRWKDRERGRKNSSPSCVHPLACKKTREEIQGERGGWNPLLPLVHTY